MTRSVQRRRRQAHLRGGAPDPKGDQPHPEFMMQRQLLPRGSGPLCVPKLKLGLSGGEVRQGWGDVI